MSPSIVFTTARVLGKNRVLVAGVRGEQPPEGDFTRVFDIDLDRSPSFVARDLPFSVTDLVGGAEGAAAFGALSEDGEISWAEGEQLRVEGIADAGLHRASSKRYGYLSSLRRIGGQLYTCGGRGQVYRRRAEGDWEHLDQGLLQTKREPHRLVLQTLEGLGGDHLYAAGEISLDAGLEGRLYHFDGAAWSRAELPKVGPLNALYLEDEGQVWAVGMGGEILCGNRGEGLALAAKTQSAHLFHDLTRFQGTLYLGSNQGLFRYDEEKRRAVRVRTTLEREIAYAAHVDQAGGVLWCVGPKDLVRFDGETWTRLRVPEELRIQG